MEADISSSKTIIVILMKVTVVGDVPFINYYLEGRHYSAVLRNPDALNGVLLTGTEIKIRLFTNGITFDQAEILLKEDDFIPAPLGAMLEKHPPVYSVFFGLCSEPSDNCGRYYMLRDHNADGLLLCTGTYTLKNGKAKCSRFDGEWQLRYNIVENFFYGFERPECEFNQWKHPTIKLRKIDDRLSMDKLNKSFRNYAAGWHRFNFFYSEDWSLKFYRKQARLGFIAITHTQDGILKLTPQLQREYAVLDWNKLTIDKKTGRILAGSRMKEENIRLHISPDPAEALAHLTSIWKETWITPEYVELITKLARECRDQNDRRFKVWGVTLTAGDSPEDSGKVIAGELGYSIGKTYTSLTGFFHRGERKYSNFGKLQLVMLAKELENAGIRFWNLGQPYMEYKLKLGADVVPRGLFLKRWDRAVRGRTPDLEK